MEEFRFLSVSFSILLGLAVARTLSSLVEVFVNRLEARITWIPITWAGIVFVLQLQFWWALAELEGVVPVWTRGQFLAVTAIPLCLFVAAAIILPSKETESTDLDEWFDVHGRWGLIALTAYALDAALIDIWMFRAPVFSLATAILVAEAALPLICIWTRDPRSRAAITVAYVVVVLGGSWALSPAAY